MKRFPPILNAGFCIILALAPDAWGEKGLYHIVEPGQNLFRISQAYQVPLKVLMERNRLTSSHLSIGQRLFIPGAQARMKVEPFKPLSSRERAALEGSLREERSSLAPLPGKSGDRQPPPDLIWPLIGPINSPFGPRGGRLHAGLDIGSPFYQEVLSAADGEVIFAGNTNNGLGRAVLIRHGGEVITVYGHLSIIIAREGEAVKQGQAIGGVGSTGNATGPHLHFEVRRHGRPVDPMPFLPPTLDDLVEKLIRP